VMVEALAEALARLDAGEEGTAQPDGGSYESFFTEDDLWLDPSRPAIEAHRLAWAWRYAMSPTTIPGALLELDGKPVRVLATSLAEVEGAQRLECGDAPLWLVETEELSEEEASRTTAPAPSTR
jgi:methionyl-tRNA formyltransferase